MSQLEAKVKLADDLQLELLAGQLKVTELRQKLEESLSQYEALSGELARMRERQKELEQQQQQQKERVVVSGMGDGKHREDAEQKQKEAEKEEKERELDDKMLTNPLVEVEEELVLYKEKYVSLSEENIRLQREMDETRKKYEDVMQRSMMKLMMYMGPVVAILGYFVLWPYL